MTLLDQASGHSRQGSIRSGKCVLARQIGAIFTQEFELQEVKELLRSDDFDAATKARVLQANGVECADPTVRRKVRDGCACTWCATYGVSVQDVTARQGALA